MRVVSQNKVVKIEGALLGIVTNALLAVEHLIDKDYSVRLPVDVAVEGYAKGEFKLSRRDVVSSEISQVLDQVLLIARAAGLPDREFRRRLDEIIQKSTAYDGNYLYLYSDGQYAKEMKARESTARWWAGGDTSTL